MLVRTLLLLIITLNVAHAAQPSFTKSKRILAEIYAEQPVSFYCGCDYKKQGKKLVPDLDSCGYDPRKNAQRAKRIEWEHVMPAWAFGHQLQCWQDGGRKNCRKNPDFKQMEADMHNLVPAVGEVNGDRSNFRYGMLEGEHRAYGACDVEIDFKARKAEPAPALRGDIARTYFYMADTYGVRLSKQQRRLFEAWAKQDPVDEWERKRNRLIKERQGNANPYVE
ncbi:endonuclease I family protein [Pontibacterium granulatum]|uniref:endonuclease I family protein n=1 Tax=Pontibacterium granulatum TaxID=2036029 RepID=UPI00249ADC31|nr:endonuclease I family protein [Pontibacterium granulatum]MDI3325431.1 endonuclease I family protein [Pontibacterium granulatum]